MPVSANTVANRIDTILRRVSGLELVLRAAKSDVVWEIKPEDFKKLYRKDKDGTVTPFILNKPQEEMLEDFNVCLRNRKPIRYQLLKARKFGGSTFFVAVAYMLVKKFGLNCVIIGHIRWASQNLYDMVLLFFEMDPENAGLTIDKKNTQRLKFAHGGGEIRVMTAGSSDSATSQTNQIIIATEQALWDDPEGQMKSLLNTVDDNVPITVVIVESTARSMNDFWDRWKRAKAGESSYAPKFVGWLQCPDDVKPFESNELREKFIQTIGSHHKDDPDANEEELSLYRDMEATPEQLNWRLFTINDRHKGDVDGFHQEHPTTPEQAFLGSGRPVFNQTKINKSLNNLEAPLFEGKINFQVGIPKIGDSIDQLIESGILQRVRGGELKLWRLPQVDLGYVAGADVSEGLEISDGQSKARTDDSAAAFREQESGYVCLTFVRHIDTELFAKLLNCIGRWYNKAFTCIEANSMGKSTTSVFWKLYPKHRIYQERMGMNVAQKERSDRIGYQTTQTTKPWLIENLRRAHSNDLLELNDEQALQQMLKLQLDQNGRTDTKGKDILMALAMSEEARLFAPKHYIPTEIKEDLYKSRMRQRMERRAEAGEQNRAANAMRVGGVASGRWN